MSTFRAKTAFTVLALLGAAACRPRSLDTLVVVVQDGDEGGDSGDLTPDTLPTTTTPPITTPGDPPALAEVTVFELPTALQIAVDAVAGDAPLEGGAVVVTLDGTPYTFDIPGDLATYAPDGQYSVEVPRPGLGGCSLGMIHDVEVSVVDSAGGAVDADPFQIQTEDHGIIFEEPPQGYVDVLFDPPVGLEMCGDISFAANDGDTYIGDVDLIGLGISSNRQMELSLDWDQVADYDLLVLDLDFSVINGSATLSNLGPESVVVSLPVGNYLVEVAAWSGAAGAWTVTVDP